MGTAAGRRVQLRQPVEHEMREVRVRHLPAGAMTLALALFLVPGVTAEAQRGRGGDAAPQAGRDGAPIDLTGYWTALITDDWQYRMITPARGDYSYIPLNAEGRRVADTWDPDRDEAAGDACKGYGAPAIMRLPTRLNITWQDADTLRVDTDLGMQTRLFYFPAAGVEPGERTWQGHSAARWEGTGPGAALQVDTTHLREGYLRKNGVPFSEDTFMTEYFNLLTEDNGDQYLVIQTFVDDPQYLSGHFVRTLQFKREQDDSGWNPTSCSAY